ncbi:hypothetical protein KFE98_18625 [bacterium SCSIO 12741]|nr:hypothetical protein KFE98_18625 [bacterium SCSIO 12741]
MKKKEVLFSLIHSLNQSEKRYFVLDCTRQKNGDNYLRLFRAIEQQNEYDEGAIRQLFEGETFLNQLSVTKNYLYKLLLKSLRNYHHHLSKQAELKDLLRNVEILFNKELYQLCDQELKKAEKLALKYELTAGLYEIYDWQRKLQQNQNPHQYAQFQATLKQQEQALKQLENQHQYMELIVGVSRSIMENSDSPVPYEQLLEAPENALTEDAATMHYNALYFKSILQNQSKQALQSMHELIDRMEKYPHRIIEAPSLYAGSVNNVVSYYVFNQDYDQAMSWIRKAQQVYQKVKSRSENRTVLKQMLRTYNIELEIYREQENADIDIQHIEDFVISKTYKMPLDYLFSFRFQLAYIYFKRGKFSQALQWVNLVLQSKHRQVRPDVQVNARFLNLMIHLELQNLFVLRYFVDSTRRYLKKWPIKDPSVPHVLSFFSRISKAPLLEYEQQYRWLYERLYPNGYEAPPTPDGGDFIHYKSWLEQKLGITASTL